jgi:hypothetical protein
VGSIPTLGSPKVLVTWHVIGGAKAAEWWHPRFTQDFWSQIAAVRGSLRERRPGVWELIVQLPRDSTSPRARQLTRTVHGTKREAQADTDANHSDVREFAAEEKRCCEFWGFQVTRDRVLLLRWDGPPEASVWMDGLVDYFEGRVPVGGLFGRF